MCIRDRYSVGMKKMGPYYMAGQKMNNTIIEYINGMEVVKMCIRDSHNSLPITLTGRKLRLTKRNS